VVFFFFNDTATTEIYTLSLHDALPIFNPLPQALADGVTRMPRRASIDGAARSEEHTSELQSHSDLVCRLLLDTKKQESGREKNVGRRPGRQARRQAREPP